MTTALFWLVVSVGGLVAYMACGVFTAVRMSIWRWGGWDYRGAADINQRRAGNRPVIANPPGTRGQEWGSYDFSPFVWAVWSGVFWWVLALGWLFYLPGRTFVRAIVPKMAPPKSGAEETIAALEKEVLDP